MNSHPISNPPPAAPEGRRALRCVQHGPPDPCAAPAPPGAAPQETGEGGRPGRVGEGRAQGNSRYRTHHHSNEYVRLRKCQTRTEGPVGNGSQDRQEQRRKGGIPRSPLHVTLDLPLPVEEQLRPGTAIIATRRIIGDQQILLRLLALTENVPQHAAAGDEPQPMHLAR